MSKFVVVISDEETGLEDSENEEEQNSNLSIKYWFDPVLSQQDISHGQITQAQDAGLLVLDVLGIELENVIEDSTVH